jgi:hypothetical protein
MTLVDPAPAEPEAVDLGVAAALAGAAAASAVVPDNGPATPAAFAWHWGVGTDALDLFAADPAAPDWRETLLGAGGALHRARVALAEDGYAARVSLLPGDPPRARGRARSREQNALARSRATDLAHLAHLTVADAEPEEARTGPERSGREARPERSGREAGSERAGAGLGTTARSLRAARRAVARELLGAARAEGVRLRLVSDARTLAGVLHGPDTREAWLRAGTALSAVRLVADRHGLAAELTERRGTGDRESWLGVGIATPYARLHLRAA